MAFYVDICGDQYDDINLYGISCFDLNAWLCLGTLDCKLHGLHGRDDRDYWIASKRLNQVARQAGVVTLPEVLHEMFICGSGVDLHSFWPSLSFYLLTQFKS